MYATMSALQAVVAFTVVSRPSEGMCIGFAQVLQIR